VVEYGETAVRGRAADERKVLVQTEVVH